MRVAGVDLSTKAIDVVSLDFDENDPKWLHLDISGGDDFERTVKAAMRVPRLRHRGEWFEDVTSIYIEWPQGPSSAKVALIAGAFIASLPSSFEGSVSTIPVGTWRKKLTGRGDADKEKVREHLRMTGFHFLWIDKSITETLDAWEALGIAVVARDEILQAFGQARPA